MHSSLERILNHFTANTMKFKIQAQKTEYAPVAKTDQKWSYTFNLALALVVYVVFRGVPFGGRVFDWKRMLNLKDQASALSQDLVDAQRRIFNASSTTLAPTMHYHVTSRPDIQSFAFDLGGTVCACPLQWSRRQYWQRLVYGTKYVWPHANTAFLAAVFLHRVQWVLLWKLANEIFEELCLGVFGAWAWYAGLPFDVEPRYDSLVLDVFLAGMLFSCLAMHIIYVCDVPHPFSQSWQYDWHSFKQVFLPILWFYNLIQTNGMLGFSTTAKLLTAVVQIAYLWLTHYVQSRSEDTILQVDRPALHVLSICLALLWICFTLDIPNANDELLKALFAFATTGFVVTSYQFMFTSKRNTLSTVLVGVYCAAMVLCFAMNTVIARHDDNFYYHGNWCGISASIGSGSCSHITKND